MIRQVTQTTNEILEAINQERESAGLKPLVPGTDPHMNIYAAIYVGVERGFERLKAEMTSVIKQL